MLKIRELLFVSFITWIVVTKAQTDVRLPPSITRSPKAEFIYRRDERIPLECQATGTGKLQYEWFKNDGQMNLNDLSQLEVIGDGSTVIIKSAGKSDEGFYQCSVNSAHGKVLSETSYLQLATIDTGSKEILEQTVLEGQPFVIKAQPQKSFPRPIYSWETAKTIEDTQPQRVPLNKRVQMDEFGNLYFAFAMLSDSIGGNIYKLVSFNQYLDQTLGGSYTRITVTPASLQSFAPTLAFPSLVTYVGVVGRNISLHCFYSANPEAQYSWSVPNHMLRTPEYNADKTRLFIRDIKPTDQGNYVCTASNSKGTSQQTLQIEVQSAPVFRQPKDRPQNVNATEGQMVTFNCAADAIPEARVVWYKDGVVLDRSNMPRRMHFSKDNRNLTIDRVCRDCYNEDRRTDLMVVQCNVSNKHGYVLGSGYLNVLVKTVVTAMSEDRVEVKPDEVRTVTFQCTATSDPSTPVGIEWRKINPNDPDYDYPVYPDNRIIFVSEGQLMIVVEQNTTDKWTELMGQYRCRANNSYSWDFKTFTLVIENVALPGPRRAGLDQFWWIFLILALLLLLLILLLCCCIYCQRNRGDSYPVDEKERNNGNDPERELKDKGFQDYQRPEGQPLRGSRGSLGSSAKMNSDDEGSLNEYGDVDPNKFNEDGSFVGVYANTADRKRTK